ncbi:MAG: DUF5050 domain-containing protein [Phaeodactylibacter sp.]|nr:DUF5050 domain-containing protein [Phaeodactylibacter sp.]
MKTKKTLLLATSLFFALYATAQVFWTDIRAEAIYQSTGGTENAEKIYTAYEPQDLYLAPALQKIYWTDWGKGAIYRSNLDGTGRETLLSGLSLPNGIVVDEAGQAVYFIVSDKIQKMGLDGSNVQVVISGLSRPLDIGLDLEAGKIYWSDRIDNAIYKAGMDGSNMEVVLSGLAGPTDIELDVAGQKVYWRQSDGLAIGRSELMRAGFDGQGEERVAIGYSFGFCLDRLNQKIYWTISESGIERIYRANLDGSGQEIRFSNLYSPRKIAVDPGAETVYWTEDFTPEVMSRAGYDGQGREVLLFYQITRPTKIFIDTASNEVYLLNDFYVFLPNHDPLSAIVRAELYDDNFEVLLQYPALETPLDFAVDVANGKIYWTDEGPNEVRRANLDGSNVETLASPASWHGRVNILELDVQAGKLYWDDPFGDKLYKMNLDGTGLEEAASLEGLGLSDMVLGTEEGELYWASGTGLIQRANLPDGEVQTLYTTTRIPNGLAIDFQNGRMYWAENSGSCSDWVMTANIDGTDSRELIDFGTCGHRSAGIFVKPFVLTATAEPDKGSFRLFPNPAGNWLAVEGPETGAELSIYDQLGRQVMAANLAGGQQRIDVSRLNNGIYFLVLRGEKIFTQRFIKN